MNFCKLFRMAEVAGMMLAMLFLASANDCRAQKTFGNIPDLHVEGKWLVDENGNKVVLHGVMDTPSPYFNSNRWGGKNNFWEIDLQKSGSSYTTSCIDYFKKLFDGLANPELGTYCNLFRLHLDPCWTNNSNVTAKGFTSKNGKTYDPNGTEVSGEADTKNFDKTRLKTYMSSLYFKIAKEALNRGMYVIMRPPGVFPSKVKVGDYYNDYIKTVWDVVTQNDSIRKYSGKIMIELGNEPVDILDANGQNKNSGQTMHDFFQPVVEKIRENGFTGIIWVPGGVWQQEYKGYKTNPITGYNIGYAVHDYVGWYGTSESSYNKQNCINSFRGSVPVVDTNPIVITEVDWSPTSKSQGHYNESGTWVEGNYGTWATGSTSKWGSAYKAMLDHFGNISMTLSGTGCLIDVDKWVPNNKDSYTVWKSKTKTLQPAFLDAMKKDGYADAWEASSGACWQWYKEYAEDDEHRPYMAYTRRWTADQGNGKFKNPILNADFPDPDVIRVNDTYYMVSTTMFHFPGATILKSKDLVNWEYCANPLKQIADNDNYNLQKGLNHYAQGQWAASLNYSGGKFYLYFIAYGKNGEDEGKNLLLTATDPEGEWDAKEWNEHYYDSGWLFDDGENGDGYVYVACGIGDIWVNKLDGRTLKKISSVKVLSHDTKEYYNSMEGSHMYHIGDFYYLYLTTGGYYRGQQIFRSSNPMGPYEECPYMVFENQGIHQGALVQTQTGEWWTVLFKDAGSIGRVPYLEPVKWVDGWPVVGKNGIDVSKNGVAYAKPNVGQTYARTYLPTNDTFTDPKLGMQWEWNHNPDNGAWSLMENLGHLRLHTTGITTNGLLQARNSLTQRIHGYTPEGTASNKVWDSYGTVKMDISHMQDGDVAGISVFQDPYSCIAVKQVDGKRYLFSERKYITDGGTDQSILGEEEITSDSIYLRAVVNFGTNKAKYYYSLDNKTYTKFGVEMDMRFILSVFVGQRFYIFNYATQINGGYVDIDWFSTEPVYDESYYFGKGVLKTFTEEDLTMAELSMPKDAYTVTPGGSQPLEIICKAMSGMTTNVASNCKYEISDSKVATVIGGSIRGFADGVTDVTATYTDFMGNSKSVTFTINVSTFPLTVDGFNPSIYGNGTFKCISTYGQLTTSQYGFGGWTYPGALDISAYKYIVVRLRFQANCQPSFRIFDENNYWSTPYIADMKKKKEVVIDLQNMENSEGRKIDPSHIYIAGFWSDGTNAMYISEVFLSNDGVNPVTDIFALHSESSRPMANGVFDIQGREMKDGASRLATGQLRSGIYIINGRKTLIR